MLTEEEKLFIILDALETDEGRQALADALVEPIRQQVGIGKVMKYYDSRYPYICFILTDGYNE